MAEKRGVRHLLPRGAVLAFLLFFAADSAEAITLTVTGGHGFIIDGGSLSGGPGSNLVSQYSGPDDSIILSVGDTLGNGDGWQIEVRREDLLWHGSLDVRLLRTGAGSGGGSISGGDSLSLTLTASDQFFFEGTGDRTDIPVRIELEGVSVLVPADTYTGNITFTLVDIP